VWQNLSPLCLKICGAVAGLVAESELHTTTNRIVAIENLKKHLILALFFGYLFEAFESLGVESLVFL
jgi:hypothetical protein